MRELVAYHRALRGRDYADDLAPLFISAFEAVETAYFRALDGATAGCSSWREGFRTGARATLELCQHHPAATRFLVVEAPAVGPLGRERQTAFAGRLAERVDAAREELEYPQQVSSATADWVVGLFINRIYQWANGSDPDLPTQLPELLFLTVSAYFGTEAGLRELL